MTTTTRYPRVELEDKTPFDVGLIALTRASVKAKWFSIVVVSSMNQELLRCNIARTANDAE